MPRKKEKPDDVLWFARAKDIKRMGPYENHTRASKALTGHDGYPVPESFIWSMTRKDYQHLKDLEGFTFPKGGGLLGATARTIAFEHHVASKKRRKK